MNTAPDPAAFRIPDAAPAPGRSMAERVLLAVGALFGFATVAMGAIAAHLPDRMLAPGGREMLRAAVQMQGWHAPALLVCGLLAGRARRLPRLAGTAFAVGLCCFCGGVYALAFADPGSGIRNLGRLTPVGGSLLMAGWLLLAAAGLQRRAG